MSPFNSSTFTNNGDFELYGSRADGTTFLDNMGIILIVKENMGAKIDIKRNQFSFG